MSISAIESISTAAMFAGGISSSLPNSEDFINKVGPIDDIIGLPPAAYYSNPSILNRVLASIPMLLIFPAMTLEGDLTSSNDEGLKLYDLDFHKGWDQYKKICNSCDIKVSSSSNPPIRVAFLHEGPISESFSNEYSESMMEQISGMASPMLKELKYSTGASSIQGAIDKVKQGIKEGKGKGAIENFFSNVVGMGLSAAGSAAGFVERFVSAAPKGAQLSKLLTGSNIDFPLIWAGSSFSPSYSITVRLTNTDPLDDNLYEERIINPLVRLLALGVPTSDSKGTYTYPLLLRASCPGLFRLNAGAVTSFEIVKGLDGSDIGYHQRPGSIDVRITFIDLYSSLIAMMSEEDRTGSDLNRPTLSRYINNLRGKAFFNNPYDLQLPTVTDNSISFNSEGKSFGNNVPIYSGHKQPKDNNHYNNNVGLGGPSRVLPTSDEMSSSANLQSQSSNTTIDDYLRNSEMSNNPSTIKNSWENVDLTEESFVDMNEIYDNLLIDGISAEWYAAGSEKCLLTPVDTNGIYDNLLTDGISAKSYAIGSETCLLTP